MKRLRDLFVPAWSRLPPPVRSAARTLLYSGRRVSCPLCGRAARRFLPAGRGGERPRALCPWCGSLERHRMAWLYLSGRTSLLAGPARMLHIAPEPALARAFDRVEGIARVTADLEADGVHVRADLSRLCFHPQTFDLVYCSHVLEHVPEDRAAMAEIRRVLKPGGAALIQVPIQDGTTFEDPTVQEPEERLAVFGQEDHVRIYGLDVVSRLEDAGFTVHVVRSSDLVPPLGIQAHGLIPEEILFHCRTND